MAFSTICGGVIKRRGNTRLKYTQFFFKKNLKNQISSESRDIAIGNDTDDVERTSHDLFRFILTVAIITFATKFKTEECPVKETWRNKLGECAVMAKLTSQINKD